MNIPVIAEHDLLKKIISQKNPFFEEYHAFYSSWFGGIIKNPSMMLVPLDDHMVHRGDGVFEAMKAVNRAVYLMNEHLERLFKSADKIALNLSFDADHVKTVVLETLRAANQNEAVIRIFLSRGPGDFSVNPYDPLAPQLYVVITSLKPPAPEKYTKGVTVGKSSIPVKSSWMAQVKSCNYLPNVLMKKEAVDRKLDFVVGVNKADMITESATENIMIVDKDENIVHPPLNNILKGTTMVRACELARENGMKTEIKHISIKDLQQAREVMITGTTLNVLPVIKFEETIFSNGQPGNIARKLNEWMIADIQGGSHSIPF